LIFKVRKEWERKLGRKGISGASQRVQLNGVRKGDGRLGKLNGITKRRLVGSDEWGGSPMGKKPGAGTVPVERVPKGQ